MWNGVWRHSVYLNVVLSQALWVSLAFARLQGEEMGDCWRHVPAYLQVGASDGAQIRWCESSVWSTSLAKLLPSVPSLRHPKRQVSSSKNHTGFLSMCLTQHLWVASKMLWCRLWHHLSCIFRRTRTRRRAKMRNMAPSWLLQRTAPLPAWWTCTVGDEVFTWRWHTILFLLPVVKIYLKTRRGQRASLTLWFSFGQTKILAPFDSLTHQTHHASYKLNCSSVTRTNLHSWLYSPMLP